MKVILKPFFLIAFLSVASFAQKPKTPIAKPLPKTPITKTAKTAPALKIVLDEGKLVGKTYANKTFDFEVTFPDAWFVPDKKQEAELLGLGYDLRMKTPPTITILQTAYKFMSGKTDNAIMRVAAEDLRMQLQIKDAVDYFDAMRKSFASAKLPADFKYSETNAERLGAKQFGFIDISSKETGKKRIYATVRNGYALIFMINHADEADIETLRSILTQRNFKLSK